MPLAADVSGDNDDLDAHSRSVIMVDATTVWARLIEQDGGTMALMTMGMVGALPGLRSASFPF
jgi:hypothetical protein